MPHEPTVIGLGEVLWDCFPDTRHPGGAPANVAYHAGQLGLNGVVCSRVGSDDLGSELLDYLKQHGLDTTHVQQDADAPTGYVTVDMSDPERPSYTIHENVAYDRLEFTPQLKSLFEEASAVCFGTLAQRNDAGREAIHCCLNAADKAFKVYDVNLRQNWYHRDWIEASLYTSSAIKLNDEEIVVLAEVLQTGSADPTDFAHALKDRYDISMTCITRAEKGCCLIEDGTIADIPGQPVTVADAVGAGDAFTAAMIFGKLQDWPLEKIARFANRVGGTVASFPGAMPNVRKQYETLVNS